MVLPWVQADPVKGTSHLMLYGWSLKWKESQVWGEAGGWSWLKIQQNKKTTYKPSPLPRRVHPTALLSRALLPGRRSGKSRAVTSLTAAWNQPSDARIKCCSFPMKVSWQRKETIGTYVPPLQPDIHVPKTLGLKIFKAEELRLWYFHISPKMQPGYSAALERHKTFGFFFFSVLKIVLFWIKEKDI